MTASEPAHLGADVARIDARLLQWSWGQVAQYGDQVPLFFYSTLFVTHPGTRDMFPLGMADQRDKLVGALGAVVSGVDDLPSVVPILEQLGRDHRRFSVSKDHYPVVGQALLATLEHFLGEHWNDDLAAQWAAAYTVVAGVMTGAAEADAINPPWYEAQVTELERRTASVAVMRITPEIPIPYRAGQSLATETSARPRMWRYYTPATLPEQDGSFELHVRAVGGGPVSTALVHGTRPGDVLRFGAPVGEHLTLRAASLPDLVMIAGGTGLAPMKALIQQLAADGHGRPVQLFWGGRHHFDLYDLPAVERLAGHDWLHFVPCVSAEAGTLGSARPGYVGDVALQHGVLADRDIYVCGPPAMVDSTLDNLRRAGVPDGRIHYERFGMKEMSADERRP
jgi:NAD(P)H-flavin reductase/hemoglobin-like flavoprotein